MIDVSHVIEHGMVTYAGLPGPAISDHLSREASRARYAPGTEFQIGRIEMVANTGTYVDAPFHRFATGSDLSQLPLASVADLPCVVVRVPPGAPRAIDDLPFGDEDARGRAVLFHTGWDRHWRTDAYSKGHPHLTQALAERLVAAGAALVGIDSFNIDAIDTGERPVHTALLGAGVPVAEHLTNLAAAPERGGRFFAVPAPVRGMGTFPVRAFVIPG